MGYEDNHVKMDKIYNRACRYYFGPHKFTPIPAMYGEWVGYSVVFTVKLKLQDLGILDINNNIPQEKDSC